MNTSQLIGRERKRYSMTDFGIGIQKRVNCDYIWGGSKFIKWRWMLLFTLHSTLGLRFFYEHVLLLFSVPQRKGLFSLILNTIFLVSITVPGTQYWINKLTLSIVLFHFPCSVVLYYYLIFCVINLKKIAYLYIDFLPPPIKEIISFFVIVAILSYFKI